MLFAWGGGGNSGRRAEAQVPASWETRAAGAKVRPPAAGTGGLSGTAWAPARVLPSSLPPGQEGSCLLAGTWAQRRALPWGRRHGSTSRLPTFLHMTFPGPCLRNLSAHLLTGLPVPSVASWACRHTHTHTLCMYLRTTLCRHARTPHPPTTRASTCHGYMQAHVDVCTVHTACMHVRVHTRCRAHKGAAARAQRPRPRGNLSPVSPFAAAALVLLPSNNRSAATSSGNSGSDFRAILRQPPPARNRRPRQVRPAPAPGWVALPCPPHVGATASCKDEATWKQDSAWTRADPTAAHRVPAVMPVPVSCERPQ